MSLSYDCKKVSNPCKICLQTVESHTGIQCMGACEAWVHYECLNYTPGKVQDIEQGIITVTCPCPDCKTTLPKEYLTEHPYTCNNVACPANNPPSCESPYCQANEMSRQLPPRCPPPGTLRSCGQVTCREYAAPRAFKSASSDKCMEGYVLNTRCHGTDHLEEHKAKPVPYPTPAARPTGARAHGPMPSSRTTEMMQQMCKTVGDLAKQLNTLMQNFANLDKGGGRVCGMSIAVGTGSGCGAKSGGSDYNMGGGGRGGSGRRGCAVHGSGGGGACGGGGGHATQGGGGGQCGGGGCASHGSGSSGCGGGAGVGCGGHGLQVGGIGGQYGGGGGHATQGGGGQCGGGHATQAGGGQCGGGGGQVTTGCGGGGGHATQGGGHASTGCGGGGGCCSAGGGGTKRQRHEATGARGITTLRQVSSDSLCAGCCKKGPPAIPAAAPCPPCPEEIPDDKCMGGCGKAGQTTCSQPCHCPGNPMPRH